MDSRIQSLLIAIRPKQWTKNLFLFAAIIFAQRVGDGSALLKVVGAFACFCFLSSGVYLVNDVLDLEQDRRHPLKSQRPVASGKIGRREALSWGAWFAAVGLAASFWLHFGFGLVCVSYLLLQGCYMFWFKHAVILDVVSVAIGFVLRAVAGAVVIGVQFSHWLMVCTFFLALFLIVCKRRHELVLLGEESSRHRRSLVGYSPAMLDQMVAVVTSSAVITYALYAVSADTVAKFGGDQLIYTLPFVVFGIFRYLYLVYRKEEGGSPEGLLLNDKPLLLNILLYGVTAALLVYWK